METKPPFIYDSLDRKNVTNQITGEKIKNKYDWRVVAVICFLIIVLLFILFLLHQQALYYIAYEYGALVILGWFILCGIYIPAIIGLSAFIFIGAKWLWNKSKIASLVNVVDHQLTVQALERLNYAKDMFEVAKVRMENSIYAGVQTLTLDQSSSVSTTGIAKEDDDLLEESKEDTETLPLFSALQSENLILRSGQSLLIGFHKEEEKE